MLKKLILNPKKDTITICLPPEWVGRPLTCIFKSEENDSNEMISEVSEDAIQYQRSRYRHRRIRRSGIGRRRY